MEENNKKERVFDFASKFLQPSLIGRLREYAEWQREVRNGNYNVNIGPDAAPISINLDLTTACNYECDHCVDWNILNQPFKYKHENLLSSLDIMHKKGLKSVILIGGGEPTLYPKFEDVVGFLKEREIQIAVVSNGTGMHKISNVGELFDNYDWVRLSLDSGLDATFQAMHKPKKPITLDEICDKVYNIKQNHKNIIIGFSYIVTWEGAYADNRKIISNIDEIVIAAKLAREHGFDYLSIKPFLERAENSAEIVNVKQSWEEYQETIRRIRESINEAKKYETEKFKIRESTNLIALENGTLGNYQNQPRNCHMTFFHGVLSPLGFYNCPVYRNDPKAQLGNKDAFADKENYESTKNARAENIKHFNATHECREVTCLYNSANWFIEDLIRNPEKINNLKEAEERKDYFF